MEAPQNSALGPKNHWAGTARNPIIGLAYNFWRFFERCHKYKEQIDKCRHDKMNER